MLQQLLNTFLALILLPLSLLSSLLSSTLSSILSSILSSTLAILEPFFSLISSFYRSFVSFLTSLFSLSIPFVVIPAYLVATTGAFFSRITISIGFSAIFYSAVGSFRSILGLQRDMEPRAERLLDRLTDINASMDAKIEDLLAIRQDIRQNNVPENALPTLFESIKLGISSQYTRYCGAAFSTLGNLVKRLFSQEQQRHIATYARLLYPVLLERLGDQKERIRTHAFQAFTDFWPASQREVEDAVLGTALTGRNPRAKQMAIEWLLYVCLLVPCLLAYVSLADRLSQMVTNHGLTFQCFVPDVVRCLEDADFSVREAAKSTLVELFVYDCVSSPSSLFLFFGSLFGFPKNDS